MASVAVALAFFIPLFATQNIALASGTFLTLLSAVYALRVIYRLVGPDWVSEFRNKLKTHLGWGELR
jgi:hypothetical protein